LSIPRSLSRKSSAPFSRSRVLWSVFASLSMPKLRFTSDNMEDRKRAHPESGPPAGLDPIVWRCKTTSARESMSEPGFNAKHLSTR
jgi:hypothetical protein